MVWLEYHMQLHLYIHCLYTEIFPWYSFLYRSNIHTIVLFPLLWAWCRVALSLIFHCAFSSLHTHMCPHLETHATHTCTHAHAHTHTHTHAHTHTLFIQQTLVRTDKLLQSGTILETLKHTDHEKIHTLMGKIKQLMNDFDDRIGKRKKKIDESVQLHKLTEMVRYLSTLYK